MTAEEAERVRESRLKAAEAMKESIPAEPDNSEIVVEDEGSSSNFSKGLRSILNGQRKFEESRFGEKGASYPTPSKWLE